MTNTNLSWDEVPSAHTWPSPAESESGADVIACRSRGTSTWPRELSPKHFKRGWSRWGLLLRKDALGLGLKLCLLGMLFIDIDLEVMLLWLRLLFGLFESLFIILFFM